MKVPYQIRAKDFVASLPYCSQPYSKRNWGHSWHSLCSYHGKMKPALAHFLVKNFSDPGDTVLDPLCGVGTIPFEACLQGRIGIGSDLSEMAFAVTKAKLEVPGYENVTAKWLDMKTFIHSEFPDRAADKAFEAYKNFGFNGKLEDYFHPDTFREILAAREFFRFFQKNMTAADAMLLSCTLHILHGNRPYALSRRSHPLTPYAPAGPAVYKNVADYVKAKIERVYKGVGENTRQKGKALIGDFQDIPGKVRKADVIITSPPFASSLRFYMQNWMRLWFCGWEKETFEDADNRFLDRRQNKSFDIYFSFFEMCARVIGPSGKVVLHLGKSTRYDMAEELSRRAVPYFREIYRGAEDVSSLERHGITDKGETNCHQFLFLERC